MTQLLASVRTLTITGSTRPLGFGAPRRPPGTYTTVRAVRVHTVSCVGSPPGNHARRSPSRAPTTLGVLVDVPGLAAFTPVDISVFVTGAFLLSSIAFLYDSRARMLLGSDGTPPDQKNGGG